MSKLAGVVRAAAAITLLPVMLVQQSMAWGKDGHMMINRLAGEALPSDVPEFLRSKSAVEALEYLRAGAGSVEVAGRAGVEYRAVA